MKRFMFPAILVLAVAGLVGIFVLGGGSKATQQPTDPNIVSAIGIHWHPHLTIFIKGQQQVIPADIGIGYQYRASRFYMTDMQMTDIHTHDDSGTLHWEVMAGPVKKDDVRLGDFFEIWGQPFSSTQILGYRNGPDGTVKMTVNGQPNTDFQNYLVKDKDNIEIRFE